MKEIIKKCDIEDMQHNGEVTTIEIDVVFDHDQEDGRSKLKPYLCKEKIEMCESCMSYMIENRRYIYGYGAMGFNKYYLYIKD